MTSEETEQILGSKENIELIMKRAKNHKVVLLGEEKQVSHPYLEKYSKENLNKLLEDKDCFNV